MKNPHIPSDPLPDRWLIDFLEGLRAKPLLPGHVYITDVFHDERCPLLTNSGPCACNADIEITDVTGDASKGDNRG